MRQLRAEKRGILQTYEHQHKWDDYSRLHNFDAFQNLPLRPLLRTTKHLLPILSSGSDSFRASVS